MNINEIREEVQRRLSSSKYSHSVLTAEIAVSFAQSTGYDKEKAEIAGLLHDIAWEYTDEENKEAIEKYHLKLNKLILDFKPNIHGYVGAAVAENEFGIHDEEILNAIRFHVSGRPYMTLLEKIIYVADHLTKGVNDIELQRLKKMPIDDVVFFIIRRVILYDVTHGKTIDARTQMTFDWYLEMIEKQKDPEAYEYDENELDYVNQELDKAIQLYQKHTVSLKHVRNLRDLGGYETLDGRKIKKNKIFRSGNLDSFTDEDYKQLSDYGINTVIDLRNESEKNPHYKKEIPGIHYVNVPISMQAADVTFFENIMDKFSECIASEESAWVAARYFLAFDMDELYFDVMSDVKSCEKIKQILRIMLSDDCTGIIIFCQSGKDRTGIVISILMCLLGVDPEAIFQDYRLSCVSYFAITLQYYEMLRKEKFNSSILNKVIDVLNIDETRVQRLNAKIIEKYADYKQYLNPEFCFTTEEALRFKEKFTEPLDTHLFSINY